MLYVAALTAAQIADVDGVAVEGTGYRPDETVTVLAGWVAGPVVHTLTVTDPDWEQALDAAVEDADVAMFRDQIDRQEREEQAQAYARQVVSDPVFQDHGSQGRDAKKLAVVQRLLPKLDEQMAWRVVRHADRIDRAELQGPREADWAEQARASMAAGMSKRGAAEELGDLGERAQPDPADQSARTLIRRPFRRLPPSPFQAKHDAMPASGQPVRPGGNHGQLVQRHD